MRRARHLRFELCEPRIVLSAGDIGLSGDWHTYGNGPSHTGYFPGNMGDSPRAELRWEVELGTFPNQVAVAEGRVYVTAMSRFLMDTASAVALDESTGQLLWQNDLETSTRHSAPTFADGSIYLQRSNLNNDRQFLSLVADTGLANWTTTPDTHYGPLIAPTMSDGTIWTNGIWTNGDDSYAGISGFDQSYGSLLFHERLSLPRLWNIGPSGMLSFYDGNVYSIFAGYLSEHEAATGAINWSVYLGSSYANEPPRIPVISEGVAYVVANSGLHAVNLETHSILWTVAENFQGMPAVAGGVVYATDQMTLRAFDAQTGEPAGTFQAGEKIRSQQPIVTDDTVIVSTHWRTHIFDLETRDEILTLPAGGALSLANASIFVADYDTVLAYDLLILPPLYLSGEQTATEGNETLTWTVTLDNAVDTDVVVHLRSSDTTELAVPASVTIPAGSTSATITLSTVDDSQLDWTQLVTVTASAMGFYDAVLPVTILDNETPTLRVQLPESAVEGDDTIVSGGIIVADVAPIDDVVVTLSSLDATELAVPQHVILRAGETTAMIDLVIVNDTEVDGPQLAEVQASVEGWEPASGRMRIDDDETPFLLIEVPSATSEGAAAATASLEIPYALSVPLTVEIFSGDESELVVPATILISAGQTSASFEMTVMDDAIIDGSRDVIVSVSAPGFTGDHSSIRVDDNESAVLTLDLPREFSEGVDTVKSQGRLQIEPVSDEAIWVQLESSSRMEIEVPSRVMIPAGASEISFEFLVKDDRRFDGTQHIQLTATVANWPIATGTIVSLDDDRVGLPGDWTTFGNGPSHAGAFIGNIGPEPKAVRRWTQAITFQVNRDRFYNRPVVVADGRVYLTTMLGVTEAFVMAFDERSGEEIWRSEISPAYSVTAPTYHAGNLYFRTSRGNGDTYLWSLNAASGAANWWRQTNAQWDHFYAPTVAGGVVWTEGGQYGGIYGIDEANGSQRFYQQLPPFRQWTPSYYENTVYSYVAGTLAAHSPESGEIEWSIDFGWDWRGFAMDSVAAISDDRAYLVGSPGLHAVDLETQSELWTVEESFNGTPAVIDETVYAIQGSQVKAYDALTGQPRGVFDAGHSVSSKQPIVTDDVIIVSTIHSTKIFSRATQELLLRLPYRGHVSLANDTLYLASHSQLYAYDLRPTGQNLENRYDVDADGELGPSDALHIINRLNRINRADRPGNELSDGQDLQLYYDVDGDYAVTPFDALQVINQLNVKSRATPSLTPAGEAIASSLHLLGADRPLPVEDTEFLDASEEIVRANEAPLQPIAAPRPVLVRQADQALEETESVSELSDDLITLLAIAR